MKTSFTLLALCAFMMMTASHAEAQSGASSSGINPTLKCVHESTDGVENFRTFEFDVTAAGDYHARFWLQPATYPDGSFTRYKVFVNNTLAGEIVPTDGEWQSASIADSPTVTLVEGLNTVSVSTAMPEFPEVETVRLSTDAETSEIPTGAYDLFMQDAINPVSDATDYATKAIGAYTLNANAGGTSMAAPHVAGVAALVLERNPNLTATQVREILARSAKKIGDYDYDTVKEFGTWNEHYGYGLIDAYNAVISTPRH